MLQLLPKSFVITERSLNMMSAHFWRNLKQASLQEFYVRGMRRVLGTWKQVSHSLCLHTHLHFSSSPGALLLKSEGSGVQIRPSALWKVWWKNPWEYPLPPHTHELGKYKRVADAGKSLICRQRSWCLLELGVVIALVDSVPLSFQTASPPPTCTSSGGPETSHLQH